MVCAKPCRGGTESRCGNAHARPYSDRGGKAFLPALPRGRVINRGVDLSAITKDTLDKLSALHAAEAKQSSPGRAPAPSASQTNLWGAIKVNDVVLAYAGPEDGWWEARVIDREDEICRLKWCDGTPGPFVRRAGELGLLFPQQP